MEQIVGMMGMMGIIEETRAISSHLWCWYLLVWLGFSICRSLYGSSDNPPTGLSPVIGASSKEHSWFCPYMIVCQFFLCTHFLFGGCQSSDWWMILEGELAHFRETWHATCVCICAYWSGPPPTVSWLLWPHSSLLHWSLCCYLMRALIINDHTTGGYWLTVLDQSHEQEFGQKGFAKVKIFTLVLPELGWLLMVVNNFRQWFW